MLKQCQCGTRLIWGDWPEHCAKCSTFTHTAYLRDPRRLWERWRIVGRDGSDQTALVAPDWLATTFLAVHGQSTRIPAKAFE